MKKINLTLLMLLFFFNSFGLYQFRYIGGCIEYVSGVGPCIRIQAETTGGNLFLWHTVNGVDYGSYTGTCVSGCSGGVGEFLFDLTALGIDTIQFKCDSFRVYDVNHLFDSCVKVIICPCDTDSIPKYKTGCLDVQTGFGGAIHEYVRIKTNFNGTNYLWYSGLGPIPQSSIVSTAPGEYEATFDLTSYGFSVTNDCHNFNVNYTNHNPYPNNTILICPCDSSIYPPMPSLDSGCISINRAGHQIVTLYTNYTGTNLYMWGAGFGPVHQTGGIPGYSATFDLDAYGLNITMECHTLYFNTIPTDPTPSNGIIICPCAEGDYKCSSNFTICQYTANSNLVELSPYNIPTGATYFWDYGDFTPNGTSNTHTYLSNGEYTPCLYVEYNGQKCSTCLSFCVGKPYTSDSSYGNNKLAVSATAFQNQTTFSLDSGCITIDKFGHQIVTLYTNYTGTSLYLWSAGFGPVPQTGGVPGVYASFDLNTFGLNITMDCHLFYFNTTPYNPAPEHGIIICPCDKNTGGNNGCKSDFSYCINTADPGHVFFTPYFIPTGATYSWDYGDGSASSTANDHYYTINNSYNACLTVYNEGKACKTCVDLCIYQPDNGGNQKKEQVISEINNNDFIIYPNPADDIINITFNAIDNSAVDIKMMDQLGKIVYKTQVQDLIKGTNTISLGLTDLPNGSYILRIQCNNTVYNKQISIFK